MTISPGKLGLYWRSARHLRPVQIHRRIWFHAIRPRLDLRPASPLRRSGTWISPARKRQSQIDRDEFCFLNEVRSLSGNGWDNPAVSKLWRYNLHYFDDLNATGAERRIAWHRDLIARWIRENQPGVGTGWEPYPTSLRIINWIKWARSGNMLTPETAHSLAVQARWLTRRLEYHLLGNHLFTNAKALVFAGCFFESEEAAGWRDLGERILAREVPEQILPDGGHFELSPMYHALALEDMLDLVNIERSSGFPVPSTWGGKIAAMHSWLATMSHPDGEIAFFNDAAIGIAPSMEELESYAARLGFAPTAESKGGLEWLRESGYIRLERGDAVALLDVARIGPDYIPGHAHADTLSFELSVGEQRVIVNSGTSVYGTSSERLRQRGTAAHNTVEIDGKDSSEVWSGFRVARRARPQGLSVIEDGDDWVVRCGHDGYTRLSGRPHHRRTWRFGGRRLVITDRVEGGHNRAVAAFHFHPELSLAIAHDGTSAELIADQKTILQWVVRKGTATIETATWHPQFGVSLATQRLLLTLVNGESEIDFSWASV